MIYSNDRKRGTALVMAIGVLGIALMLGMAYVKYMETELDAANFELRKSRARAVAEGGMSAALVALTQAAHAKQTNTLIGKPQTFSFSTYGLEFNGSEHVIERDENRTATANVAITDEGAKVNLNCASSAVLQAALKVNAATAQKIYASLHKPDNRQWLASIDDLAARDLLPAAQVATLDPSLVTVVSSADPAHPEGHLNINAAPVEALAAVLGVSKEAAEPIAAKRPFASLDAFLQAAGKAPADPNIQPADSSGGAWSGLGFEPRCFRLVCEALYATNGKGDATYDRALTRIEAVALFRADGGYDLVEWKAGQG